MSRRPDVPAPAVSTKSATGPKALWDNPKVKIGGILVVTVLAAWFLYRTVRKRQVKTASQPKEEEAQQWQSNFEAPRPRPRPRPVHAHPAVTMKPAPRRQSVPNANNQTQLPPADVGNAAGNQLRPESTRPIRQEAFAEPPQSDVNPATAPAKEADGFTEL